MCHAADGRTGAERCPTALLTVSAALPPAAGEPDCAGYAQWSLPTDVWSPEPHDWCAGKPQDPELVHFGKGNAGKRYDIIITRWRDISMWQNRVREPSQNVTVSIIATVVAQVELVRENRPERC